MVLGGWRVLMALAQLSAKELVDRLDADAPMKRKNNWSTNGRRIDGFIVTLGLRGKIENSSPVGEEDAGGEGLRMCLSVLWTSGPLP